MFNVGGVAILERIPFIEVPFYNGFVNELQATHEEMKKRQSLLPTMKEVLQQLCDLSEEGELTETKTNYENLVDQWNQLSDRLTMWIAKLQTELNSVDSLFVDFQATLMKVKDWMSHTEGILSSHDNLSADQQRTDHWVDRIKVRL